jgi:tyrosinase
VDLGALQRRHFTGVSTGGSPGFGGVDTGFSHGGPVHGELERMPHDQIHVLVGGGDPHHPTLPGLMSDPDTAALDPIFWLHHANMDRLWEVWNKSATGHHDPTDAQWKNGPASVGDRAFEMPDPDGSTWTYTPQDMKSVTALGYDYDDLTPTGSPQAARPAAAEGVAPVSSDAEPELVGATSQPIALEGASAAGDVQLDRSVRRDVAAAFTATTAATPADDAEDAGSERVFLNLENVRGSADTTVFEVYVGLGADDSPADHPGLLAGSIAPFGVRKATQPDGDHQGQGLTFVLDITEVARRLHLDSSFDVDRLPVRLVPLRPVRAGAGITVGRISIYRQAA